MQEGHHDSFGFAVRRAMEAVDTVLVEELELRFEKQVFLVTSMIQGFEVTLPDRYLNPVLLMVNRIVKAGADNLVGHLRCPSNLVKRLVAEEDPIVLHGVWVAICL